MLLLSGEWVRQGFSILCLVVIYFWMQRSGDFANEQSNLFYEIAALFHVINLQMKQNRHTLGKITGLFVSFRGEKRVDVCVWGWLKELRVWEQCAARCSMSIMQAGWEGSWEQTCNREPNQPVCFPKRMAMMDARVMTHSAKAHVHTSTSSSALEQMFIV